MANLLFLVNVSLVISTLSAVAWIFRPYRYRGRGAPSDAVTFHVLVLGDLGRSPRMTYHALSIAKLGGKVELIGYLGACSVLTVMYTCSQSPESPLHPDVADNKSIRVVALPRPLRKPGSTPFLVFAPVKVLHQVYHLLGALLYRTNPAEWLLVQNPPSIPTLVVAALACRLRGTRLMIDWHNFGWTILAGTLGARHPLVLFSRLYEQAYGRLGFFNLTVTDAMARQLRRAPYKITAPTMPVHDRPADIFQPVPPSSTRAKVLDVLDPMMPDAAKDLVPRLKDGTVRLLVSSTSWTPDEDFSLLLDALVQYANPGSPDAPARTPLLAVITGKGPQKAMYTSRVAELTSAGRLPGVTVATAFLPLAGYAALLACADLGVCLHRSTSGVDLPMKVVDMFGAGLPVAAYAGYESFSELVREGENGRGFETADELAGILVSLLGGGREGKTELEALRRGAVKEGSRRWDDEWESTVGVILGLTGQ